jgi:hypothetical protein
MIVDEAHVLLNYTHVRSRDMRLIHGTIAKLRCDDQVSGSGRSSYCGNSSVYRDSFGSCQLGGAADEILSHQLIAIYQFLISVALILVIYLLPLASFSRLLTGNAPDQFDNTI